jgi:hypothetical protein
MTTFTTEDRIIAEGNGSVTINVEPIPFAGLITITESAPKYKELTDEEIKILATQARVDFSVPSYVEFARTIEKAILRKAQEK